VNVAVVGPDGPGSLANALRAGFDESGINAVVVPTQALTGGKRALIVARRHGAEKALSRVLTSRLIRQLRSQAPDVVLVVKGRFLSGGDVERVRRAIGVPVVNFYPDHPYAGPPYASDQDARALQAALPSYDRVFTWSEMLVERLRGHGARAVFMPFGYDPGTFSARPPDRPYKWDVSFVGQWYPERQEALASLAELDLVISGSGWAEAVRGTPLEGHVLTGARFARHAAEAFWDSRVSLNLLATPNLESHNMRTWELPATATACVMSWTPFHEQLFAGSGVPLVREPAELRSAVGELLSADTSREQVAQLARASVEQGTYARRAADMLAELGL
jgi:spore maturation protein CgeB